VGSGFPQFGVRQRRHRCTLVQTQQPTRETRDSRYFFRLGDAVRGLATDPATASDPIRRTFLCDGEHVSCNVNVLQEGEDVVHIQPDHDELVLVDCND
jgi:hypothetical protein